MDPFGTVDDHRRVGIDAGAVGDDAIADEVAAHAKLEHLGLGLDGFVEQGRLASARAERVPPVLAWKRALESIGPITGAERPPSHPRENDSLVLSEQVSPPHD